MKTMIDFFNNPNVRSTLALIEILIMGACLYLLRRRPGAPIDGRPGA